MILYFCAAICAEYCLLICTWLFKAPPRHISHWLAVTTGSLFMFTTASCPP